MNELFQDDERAGRPSLDLTCHTAAVILRRATGSEPRRRAALVCFLWQSYRDAVDQAVDMFDKFLVGTQTQAQNEIGRQLSRQRRSLALQPRLD